jgi:hypothetical protein
MVERELMDGLGVVFGNIFPLEMRKEVAESRSLLF